MGTYVIETANRKMKVECKECDLCEIASEMTALIGKVAIFTLDYNIFTESNIECDDWSKSHVYEMWLIDNADNLGIENPY